MSDQVFKVVFINQGSVYEIYAKSVRQADLFGFIEVETFVFGETSSLVVDPSEEKIRNEFQGVKRSCIPVHTVLRIDEVERRGTAKIRQGKEQGTTVTPFPSPLLTPKGEF